MKKDEKLDVILVQAFPANRTLSAGVVEYLNDYFRVHFIDLPGFHPSIPVTCTYSIEDYANYVESRIEQLDLESYILAGISFGFLIINNLNFINKDNCLAILASGPFLGHDHLNFTIVKKWFYFLALNFVIRLGLENYLWGRKAFGSILSTFLGKNKNKAIIETLIREVDPKAFFKTGFELLRYKQIPRFHQLPHILLINPYDDVVDFQKTLQAFWYGVEADKLRVILTHAPHYPQDPSYEYFKRTFTNNEIVSLFNFVNYIKGTQEYIMTPQNQSKG